MIDKKTRKIILNLTQNYWNKLYKTSQVQDMLGVGKETGHHIADFIDKKTTDMLNSATEITTGYECDKHHKILKRSMGDVWVKSNGIYNPVNIKAGIVTSGQPNIVSLTKLLDRLLKHQIDSYDLLIVKIDNDKPKVLFIDLFDYIDCITFDMGPGQLMLKETEFYKAVSKLRPENNLHVSEKINKCMALMQDGYDRLLKNRKKRMSEYSNRINNFAEQPINQSGLYFG